MSDDRLFASNNAIGRKWYFLNIIILAVIVIITKFIFDDYIEPNIKTEVYEIIATWILYFAYVIYGVTFLALIDRRLYDVIGSREKNIYKNTSAILTLSIFVQIVAILTKTNKVNLGIDPALMQIIALFFAFIFLAIIFFIGLQKGKITNLTYEQYKNRIKYR